MGWNIDKLAKDVGRVTIVYLLGLWFTVPVAWWIYSVDDSVSLIGHIVLWSVYPILLGILAILLAGLFAGRYYEGGDNE